MSEREQQLRDVYAEHRLRHQLDYYRARIDEYEAAASRASRITIVLMALTALAAAAGFFKVFDWGGWSIIAAAAPALVTALTAYEGLYGFDRNAKLYADAVAALEQLETVGDRPVSEWIAGAEAAMRREQNQWGQLALEAEPPG